MPLVIRTLLLLLFLLPMPCRAGLVELPLRLKLSLLQHEIAHHLGQQDGRPVTLYQDGPLRFLTSDRFRLVVGNGRLHFVCHGKAAYGFAIFGAVPASLRWSGSIDLTLQPYVNSSWHLCYRIIDSSLIDDAGNRPPVSGFIWDLVKHYLHPRLEQFSLDLSLPSTEMVAIIQACATETHAAEVDAMLRTLRVAPLRVDAAGLIVPLQLMVHEEEAAPQPTPEAPLQQEEIELFRRILEPWDAFLVFVIKNTAADGLDEQMRGELFDLLINSRYQLLPILSGEGLPEGGDPLRMLFIDVWRELRDIIEKAEERGLPQGQLLRYVTFLHAGDALLALDHAAPGLGLRISIDGLRRWARTLQPTGEQEPLHFDWQIDPQLRDLFLFPPEAEPPPPTLRQNNSFWDLLIPRVWAAEDSTLRSLDGWVPHLEELLQYQQIMEQLLMSVAHEVAARDSPPPPFAKVFEHLLPATALIESCWRQYELQNGKPTFLCSRAGAIGIMQVNQHVWRGFYDLQRLRWEAAYNARAGAAILLRYLRKYGIEAGEKSRDINNAIRATYGVYHGGPRAARRFMQAAGNRRDNPLDNKFWKIYQGLAAGGTVNLSSCSVDLPDG